MQGTVRHPRANLKLWVVAGSLIGFSVACGTDPGAIPLDPPASSPGTTAVVAVEPTNSSLAEPSTVPGAGGTRPPEVAPLTSAADPDDDWSVASEWVNAATNLAGLESECGNMSHVAVHPTRDDVIAGIALRGLWRSRDDNSDWNQLGDGPGSDQITNRTTSVAFDPVEPERFWQSGIYSGGGVYRTDDGGEVFTQLGDLQHVDLVGIDFTDPLRRTLLAGIHETSTIMRSADGGATWEDVSAGLPPDVGFTSSPHVIDAATFLLGTKGAAGAGIFRSEDGGESWGRILDTGVVGTPVESEGGNLFWLLEGGAGLARSTDAGVTWTQVAAGGAIDPLAASLVELQPGVLATVGGGRIVTTRDGGTSWFDVGPSLPFRPTGIAYAPARGAMYAWTFDCDFDSNNPIRPDSIVLLDLVPSES